MIPRIGWGLLRIETVRRGYANIKTGTFVDAVRPSVRLGALLVPIAIGDQWIIWPDGLGVIVS